MREVLMNEKTNLLQLEEHFYQLVDVDEPNTFRNLFPYSEVPKIAFNDRIVPHNMPEDIWITDTTFRDGQQSRAPYTMGMLREEQRHGQRRPAPHLTAQVGREHRHQRPDLLSAEQHQHEIQRQVSDEGVKVLGSRGTGAKVEDALQCQQPGGAARQRPALFARPADGAERRTEQDAENAYCCAVQHFRQNARGGHRTTFFPAKEYSRY